MLAAFKIIRLKLVVVNIIGFLISSIFANGSSFNQQKFSVEGDGIPSYRATNRFLSSECIDWCRVTAETAAEVITTELDPISSKAKEDGVVNDHQLFYHVLVLYIFESSTIYK